MAAISGLQQAQYGRDYKTSDDVRIDYVRLAAAVEGIKSLFGGYSPDDFLRALREARAYDGLSVIHVPVYYGEHELGGLGAFGSWNVGNWCEDVQREHHRIGL
jgi:3D-(3,5/4)-trihydroxycyclohexane-1,2-dione acylhydrolase (decyclizing)